MQSFPSSATRESFRAAVSYPLRYRPLRQEQRPAFTYNPSHLRNPRTRLLDDIAPTQPWHRRAYGTLRGLLEAICTQRSTAQSAILMVLDNVRAYDGNYNAYASLNEEEAINRAKVLDRRRPKNGLNGPLDGIPVSIKDVIHAAGIPTTGSSAVPTGFLPQDDAPAVARIRQASGIILGKTHTHEFALGVTQPQSANPWDSTRVPGGSSGGAAIALITGMCLVALGTDTRASIRVPAALCGAVGYKPTYGLLPTEGTIPLSWSMDHCAPMGRTVEDVALVAEVVAREAEKQEIDLLAYAHKDVRGLRVGIPEAALVGADAEVAEALTQALEVLSGLGVEPQASSTPNSMDLDTANAMGLVVSRCEAAAYHGHWLARYPTLYTRDVYEQLDEATKVRAVDYLQAQRYRAEFVERMCQVFETLDALVMPTTLIPAPRKTESEQQLVSLSRNCVPWSFAGFPAISVPGGLTRSGLPVGVQVVGPPYADGVVLALAAALERSEHLDHLFYSQIPKPWRLSFWAPSPQAPATFR